MEARDPRADRSYLVGWCFPMTGPVLVALLVLVFVSGFTLWTLRRIRTVSNLDTMKEALDRAKERQHAMGDIGLPPEVQHGDAPPRL